MKTCIWKKTYLSFLSTFGFHLCYSQTSIETRKSDGTSRMFFKLITYLHSKDNLVLFLLWSRLGWSLDLLYAAFDFDSKVGKLMKFLRPNVNWALKKVPIGCSPSPLGRSNIGFFDMMYAWPIKRFWIDGVALILHGWSQENTNLDGKARNPIYSRTRNHQ